MAKRISLREFQANLSARLTSATRGEGTQSLLGVRAGGKQWLLPLTEAGEVIPLPPVMTVPLTQPWFAGVVNIRGTLFSVVDFSAYQGLAPTVRSESCRLLLVGSRFGLNAALLVDRVVGLRSLASLTPADLENNTQAWIEQRFTDEEGLDWFRLNTGQLLAEPEFLNVGL